jgi:hypothetical protein
MNSLSSLPLDYVDENISPNSNPNKRSRIDQIKENNNSSLNPSFVDSITLCVGGTMFITTLTTLFSIGNTYFTCRFQGNNFADSNPTEAQLIDRDSTHFRHILNYLRDHTVVEYESLAFYSQFLQEAKFYAMEPLVNDLNDIIKSLKTKQMVADMSEREKITRSNSLTQQQHQQQQQPYINNNNNFSLYQRSHSTPLSLFHSSPAANTSSSHSVISNTTNTNSIDTEFTLEADF